MSPREKENTQRINVFFSTEILNRIKEEAKSKGTTVSGLIRMIVIEYFQKKEKR